MTNSTVLKFIILVYLFFAAGIASASGGDFYWKNSYGRGAGTALIQVCSPPKTLESGLCYDPPRQGYDCNKTNTCVARCPDGYKPSGMLTCHYQGQGSYSPVHWDDCKSRAPKWLGHGCIGGTVEDGCKDGYQKRASMCYKAAPHGFGGSGQDPTRPTYSRGVGTVPNLVCPAGKENNASLCYPQCRPSYKGNGPVCWGDTPPNYIECGAGFARNKSICNEITSNQAQAVIFSAMGSPSAATLEKARKFLKASSPAAIAKMVPKLEKAAQPLVKAVKSAMKEPDTAKAFSKLGDAAFSAKDILDIGLALKDMGGTVQSFGHNPISGGTQKEQIFANIRAFADIYTTVITAYSLSNPEVGVGIVQSANAVGVMSAYLYTIYGQ
jgi:hypothetical protein